MIIQLEYGLLYQALTVALILVVTYVFGWAVSNILRRAFKKAGLAETEMATVGSVVKYSIYFAGILIALNYLGIPVAYFLIALALVAAVLGISARSALDNILSGYSLRLYGPFTVGDVIEIEGRTGRVRDMTPLKTVVETADHLTYSISNSKIMQLDVSNFSKCKSDFPVEVEFEVSRTGDLDSIKLELLEIVGSYPKLSLDKPVKIHIERFSQTGLALKLVFYVPSFEIMKGAQDFVASEVLRKIAAGKIPLLDSCNG